MVLGLGNSIISGVALESVYATTQSWNFDFSDDYINLGGGGTSGAGTIKPTATDTSEGIGITIHAWVKHDAWHTNGVTSHIVSSAQSGGWYIGFVNTRAYWYIKTADSAKTIYSGFRIFTTNVENGDPGRKHYRASGWHQIVGTFDGRYSKLYIDGELCQHDPSSTNATIDIGSDDNAITYSTANSNTDVLIGGDPNPMIGEEEGTSPASGNYMDGLINEVAIWNKALDVEAISEIFEAVNTDGAVLDLTKNAGSYDVYADSLLGLWRADGDASTAADSSGNSPFSASIKNSLGYSSTVPS